MDPRHLIIKPVLSEKSFKLQQQGIYTFWVSPKATKTQIKQAIQTLFNVKVIKVNLAAKGSQTKYNWRHRHTYTTPRRKKAYVKIAPEQKIQLLEGK